MKKYIKWIILILVIVFVFISVILVKVQKNQPKTSDNKFKIVTSFYPIYVMTANITEGAQNIDLVNMTDTNIGCIHNYTLTTADMKKIEKADVFIQNGLGLESFIDKITTANKVLEIINSSENIQYVIKENEETNPHIWTSITNYIAQVENITQKLKEKNPKNAEIYETNSKKYIEELKDLKLRYDKELDLKGQTSVTLNENFAYLGKEIGLDLTVIQTSHEESSISAETMKNVIDMMKQADSKIILIDVDEDDKNAQTIAKETGAKIYRLNSGIKGNMNNEAYIDAMKSNLEILKNKE